VLGDASPSICAVVAQPAVASTAASIVRDLEASGVRAPVIDVPAGGAAKTMTTVEEVCLTLASAGVTRDDMVLGVGGGGVTDLTGFVAAVYMRGIRAHFVPTTLLAAVDAAIGGKSGIDIGGKNLIGGFRHPARVVIDLEILDALPPPLIREGMAEALKSGLVGDPGLVEVLERDGVDAALDEVVSRSLAVKARIVGRDFEERGERVHLNYGHTIGHALESATRIPHGEAVAIGMIGAGRASALVAGFDDEDRQREAIAGLGLPTSAPAVGRQAILDLMWLDKKRRSDDIRMVLLEAVGHPLVAEVSSATVDAALTASGIPGGDS
jgi:3-dehydroquinate synthase